MGNLGIFASRYNINTKSLEAFDASLQYLKKRREIRKTAEVKEMVDRLLDVITPILESIEGNLSESIAISDHSVVGIIKEKHDKEWPVYRVKIKQLHSKLHSDTFSLSEGDFSLLNDIADAIDVECGNLFRRMSES